MSDLKKTGKSMIVGRKTTPTTTTNTSMDKLTFSKNSEYHCIIFVVIFDDVEKQWLQIPFDVSCVPRISPKCYPISYFNSFFNFLFFTELDRVGQSYTNLGQVRSSWTEFDRVGPNRVRPSWPRLDRYFFIWTKLNRVGPIQAKLARVKLGWTDLGLHSFDKRTKLQMNFAGDEVAAKYTL